MPMDLRARWNHNVSGLVGYSLPAYRWDLYGLFLWLVTRDSGRVSAGFLHVFRRWRQMSNVFRWKPCTLF